MAPELAGERPGSHSVFAGLSLRWVGSHFATLFYFIFLLLEQ